MAEYKDSFDRALEKMTKDEIKEQLKPERYGSPQTPQQEAIRQRLEDALYNKKYLKKDEQGRILGRD